MEYDKNGDGQLHRGTDLVLQTLFDEWQDYRQSGGSATCVNCHMPLVAETRAAEHADIPFEQDGDAPKRQVHDHSFVGADYPLDDRAARDALRPAREALLRRAASLSLVPDSLKPGLNSLSFAIEVSNTGTGHNLPGGFAFVRQMWLEVTVLDSAGRVLADSGRLRSASDDLCDASILDDPQNPMRGFVEGLQNERSAAGQFSTNVARLHAAKARREGSGGCSIAEASRCSSARRVPWKR